jgi:DNA-binding SARP family transcriptional activator/ABC-type transport system substrate-binding protein
MITFELLGPLTVRRDGVAVELGGQRQRLVLAVLLLRYPDPASRDRLIDDLWGEHPPSTASKTLQVYVSRLRKVLGEGVVETTAGGYRVSLTSAERDFDQVEALRKTAQESTPSAAANMLRDALALWRGPALGDLRYLDAVAADVARFDELRLVTLEDRIDLDLQVGRQAQIVSELEAAVQEHPLRERLRASYMLALYRLGRQADALAAYRDGRRILADELGLEPGPELRELEKRILDHDPDLAAPAGPHSRAARRRTALLVGLAGLVLLAAAGAATIALRGESGGSIVAVRGDAAVAVDGSSGGVDRVVSVRGSPVSAAASADRIWIASEDSSSATLVDRQTGNARYVQLQLVPTSLAATSSAVYVGGRGTPGVIALDPVFGRPRPGFRTDASAPIDVRGIAVADNALWAIDARTAVRLDAGTGRERQRVELEQPTAVAAGPGGVGYIGTGNGEVVRVDPVSGVAARTRVTDEVRALAVGGRFAWVLGRYSGTLWKLDADSLAIVALAQVDETPGGENANGAALALAGPGVWVADDTGVRNIAPQGDDPSLLHTVKTIRLSSRPTALAVTRENLWLATSSVGAPIAAADTLRINRPDDEGDSIDPALAWSPSAFQRAAATCAGLLGYPEDGRGAGLRLQPELARSMPAISADGLTYTFTLRRGYRFAPPSGASVTPADVKASVERALSPRWPGGQPPGAAFLSDLAGFARFQSGASQQISGITTRGSTISFRLVHRAPDFPVRLAMPFFCTLPRGAPISVGGMGGPIPTAGPYYIASGRASSRPHRIVLLRNPGYTGPKSRVPERIVYDIGPDGEETRTALEAGTTDYSDGQMLDATYRRLLANQTNADSASASNGQPQLYANPTFDAVYLVLNTSRPLFADAERRKQVMRAIDRKKLLATLFGIRAGSPSDQYLLPGFPGFRDVDVAPPGGKKITSTPTPSTVRRAVLVLDANPLAYSHSGAFIATLRRDLERIGIELAVHRSNDLGRKVSAPSAHFDITVLEFEPDTPDPSSVLNHLFQTGREASDGLTSKTTSRFSDRTTDRQLRTAATLAGAARLRAYSAIDARLARDLSPLIPIGTYAQFDVFSARIGCQRFHPQYGTVLGALCLDRK